MILKRRIREDFEVLGNKFSFHVYEVRDTADPILHIRCVRQEDADRIEQIMLRVQEQDKEISELREERANLRIQLSDAGWDLQP